MTKENFSDEMYTVLFDKNKQEMALKARNIILKNCTQIVNRFFIYLDPLSLSIISMNHKIIFLSCFNLL